MKYLNFSFKSFWRIVCVALLLLWAAPNTAAKSECQPLNTQILSYAKSKIGKKVGRGECWDLAQAALDHHGASWKRPLAFGRNLGSDESPIPGDIIQFKNAVVKWKRGNAWGTMTLGYPDHTAIIYKANGTEIELIHQNSNGVRKVTAGTALNLKEIVSGSYRIYRPVKCKKE
jgi:hypothetical protein